MKLTILSRNARLYSTQRLVEAARKRRHTVRVIDPLRCYMSISPGSFAIHFKGKPLGPVDCVIPRIGASSTFYGTAVLRQLEQMGVYTPNPSDAVLQPSAIGMSILILAFGAIAVLVGGGMLIASFTGK